MILDSRAPLPAEVDLVVIGGGTIGLPLARELARQTDKQVLVLESGGWSQEADTHPFNAAEQVGLEYDGAAHGRFRCLGGTSTRWGGALIPYQPKDMAGWPIGWGDLQSYVPHVEELFGLDPGPYDADGMTGLVGEAFTPRLAKWPPFGKRNVWKLLGNELGASKQVQIAIDSRVTGLVPGENSIRVSVVQGGSKRTVRAGRVIIAAGAIESTRLALLLDRAMGGAVSRLSPALGRYFSDHLSAPVARVMSTDRAALNRLFGLRFAPSGMMRNLRFEPCKGPRGFVHIGYETDGDGGFDHLRAVMQQVQRGALPALSTLTGLFRNLPWLAKAAKWRFIDKRQLFPDDAALVVHAVVEQLPDADNRIGLSDHAFDEQGTPLPVIEWGVDPQDVINLHALKDAIAGIWTRTDLRGLGRLDAYPVEQISDTVFGSGGIYHPTGSTRMGQSAADGVVDANLRLFAEPRVQLVSTSVLPSGGGANPTMTALLLAMRLAAQHGRGDGAG